MVIKWFSCVIFAALLIGCGSSDRPDQIAGGEQVQNAVPLTVRKVAEFTYSGSLQEILDAYTFGYTDLIRPRLVAEFNYDLDGRIEYEKVTSFRENESDDFSVVPAGGAIAFDMTYTYDPLNPSELAHYRQRNWGFWWFGDHGLLNSITDVNFIRDNGELVMLDSTVLMYESDLHTGGRTEASYRTVSELHNTDGRTVQIDIYSNVAPGIEPPVLDTPSFIDYYSYSDNFVVGRERIDASGELVDYQYRDTYIYNDDGGLLTYTIENSEFFRPRSETVFEHVIFDHQEYGRAYARISSNQSFDELGNAFPGDIIVSIYELAACEPHNSNLIGAHYPQWAACWSISAWGE